MPKQIPLTQGKFALVDDDMYDFLMQWKWNIQSAGYAVRQVRHERIIDGYIWTRIEAILMHRLVCNPPEGLLVDHINRDKLDNRRENLRPCTVQQNFYNIDKRPSNRGSKYKGVRYCKDKKRYLVFVSYDSQRLRVGSFKCEIEAARAYNEAAKKYQGEFAYLNDV
jgi:hypothetical protein